jgi:hypothetical protein
MSESVKVEIQIGATQKKLADLIIELVKDIKAKKPVAAIGAENFPAILDLADEISGLGEEFKNESEVALGAYIGIELEKALKA